MSPGKPIRRWLAFTIGSVWIATILAVFIASRTHPATRAKVVLSVREISFRTNAGHILAPSDEEQLLVSGVETLRIQLKSVQAITTVHSSFPATLIQIDGEPSASCTFYRVRSGGLDLSEASIVRFTVPNITATRSFSLKVHGALSGRLTSRPGEAGLNPGVECTRVRMNGVLVEHVAVPFSPQGGDAIFLATSSDAQLSFDLAPQNEIGDTQLPILGEVRLSHIDPRTSVEKTVLLKNKNEVSFEKLGKIVPLDEADILVVDPKNEFYVDQFMVRDGIHLSLRGVARDIRAGAAASDLATLMPSSLDHLDNLRRIYGIVPSIVGLILGILEKMGVLPGK
jgi:hypothetical protein